MGFLSGVGKFFKGDLGSGGPTPTQSISPELRANTDKQASDARAYRERMGEMKQSQGVQAQENSRQGLSSKIADIRSGSNKRGLLYSGLRQGAEAQAGTDAAGELAQQRAQINTQVEDQANQLDSQALGSAFATQKAQQDLNDSAYQDALQRKKQGMGIMSMVGSGIGAMAGSKAGG